MVSPVPALPDAERRTQAVLTASAGPVSVNFALYGDGTDYQNWVKVYLNGVEQDPSTWTLTTPSGAVGQVALPIQDAVITFKSAVTGTVQIVGARRPRRLGQITENQGVPAHDLNVILTDLAAELREAWDARLRSFQVPPGEFPGILPPAATRANQNAIFDGNGNLTSGLPAAGTVNVSSAMAALLGLASVALARAQLGTAETVALAQATAFDTSINTVETLAFATAGDEGGARYKRLAGAPSPITLAHFQSVGGVWWELRPPSGVYRPEQFGAKGDGTTDDAPAINAMFEYVPWGATCFFGPKNYRVKKQTGQTYGIRLRKAIRMIGSWGGGDNGTAAIVYDNTFTSFDHVFLIQAPGTDVSGAPATLCGLEIAGLYFVPFAASLGFILTQFAWDPTKEYCLYARDVVHFDVRGTSSSAGLTGIDKLWMHDCYMFTSGGLGGGQGDGVSLNLACGLDSAGVITSLLERLFTSGGIKFTNTGDSVSWRDLRMDGKGGIEGTVGPGAVEALFDQLNYAGNGPAFVWHWGKFRGTGWNFEAHGVQVRGVNAALVDIRNDVPGVAGQVENGMILDGITLGDQSDASTPLSNLMFVDKTFAATIRRVNMYSTNGVAVGIGLGAGASYCFLEGPYTRQGSFTAPIVATTITTLIVDNGVGNYGVDQIQGGTNANAAITMGAGWSNVNTKMRKNITGYVQLGGAASIGALGVGTIVTLPVGFRPDASRVFAAATNGSGAAATCSVQVNSAGQVSLVAFSAGPTQVFLDGIAFKETNHDGLLMST